MDYPLKEYDDGTRAGSQWGLHRIVSELRTLRSEWRQNTKPDGVTYELPSQEALADIPEGLSAALFPRHFGPSSLTEGRVDYFIGRTLDGALQSLLEQVRRELRLPSGVPDNGSSQQDEQANKITHEFAANLPKVRALLESDILAAVQGDPAAQSVDEVLFCYPGVVAITRHRLAHALYELGAPLLARIIAEIAHSDTGIDIHPGATAAAFLLTTAPVSSSARLQSSAGTSACIRA
jgi:serine O-acetyltransferase